MKFTRRKSQMSAPAVLAMATIAGRTENSPGTQKKIFQTQEKFFFVFRNPPDLFSMQQPLVLTPSSRVSRPNPVH